jgi:hypothetical protein
MNRIKEIFLNQWLHGFKALYFAILICFSLIAFYNLDAGSWMSGDSITFYSPMSDYLLEKNFNFYEYFKKGSGTWININYVYTLPVFLMALTKIFFGTDWQYAFMIFNLFLIFLSLIIFSKSLLLLNVRPLVISLAMPIICLSVDLLTWPRYILSDTIFSFLVISSVYFIVKNIIKEKENYFLVTLLMILMFLTRPTSLPYIFAICLFILISKSSFVFKSKLIIIFIFSLIILTPIIFSILHHFMELYLTDIKQVDKLLREVKIGVVIGDRPDTWVEPPSTYFDIVYLYFIRMISFFNPNASEFSIIHTILNIFQTFIMVFSIIIWSYLNENIQPINKTFFLVMLLSLSVTAFHSFTIIDYDWRYRFPLILPLIMLFPISIEILIRKINFKYY